MIRKCLIALQRLNHNPFGDVLGAAALFAMLIVGTWWVDALQVTQ